MSDDERGFLYAAGYNILIISAIVVIVVSGLLLGAGWDGLWSLLLLFSMASHKSDRNEPPRLSTKENKE